MVMLRDEHVRIQQLARRFAEQEVMPIADELDQREAPIPDHILL